MRVRSLVLSPAHCMDALCSVCFTFCRTIAVLLCAMCPVPWAHAWTCAWTFVVVRAQRRRRKVDAVACGCCLHYVTPRFLCEIIPFSFGPPSSFDLSSYTIHSRPPTLVPYPTCAIPIWRTGHTTHRSWCSFTMCFYPHHHHHHPTHPHSYLRYLLMLNTSFSLRHALSSPRLPTLSPLRPTSSYICVSTISCSALPLTTPL